MGMAEMHEGGLVMVMVTMVTKPMLVVMVMVMVMVKPLQMVVVIVVVMIQMLVVEFAKKVSIMGRWHNHGTKSWPPGNSCG